jgi:hypothetical protein
VRAAIAMRPMIRAGESILTNIHDDHDREFIAHGVISAFARAFVSGHGIRVVRDSAAATGRDIREQAGYRAIAFWSTGDTGLLADLHGKNLRRHLFERHERPLGGVTAAGARRFVFVAAGSEIFFRGLDRLDD